MAIDQAAARAAPVLRSPTGVFPIHRPLYAVCHPDPATVKPTGSIPCE